VDLSEPDPVSLKELQKSPIVWTSFHELVMSYRSHPGSLELADILKGTTQSQFNELRGLLIPEPN